MKKAAVIGPRSMLGHALVERLRRLGVETVSVGRAQTDDIVFDLVEGAPIVPDGLTVDALFHVAASFGDDGPSGIRQNFAANTMGALHVAELAQRLRARTLIHAGSLSSDATLDEAPLTSYGMSKQLAEKILEWSAQKHGFGFCSLRFSQLYDVEGRCCAHQPWFGRIIAYASRGMDLRMPTSHGVRNFLHVQDAADLMIRAAETGALGVLDAVHTEAMTSDAIAALAYETFGRGGQVVIATEKAPFRKVNFPDGATTLAHLGMQPLITMRDGIAMIKTMGTADAFGPMDVK
ncbi:NAD(P)-dependent oxidoreductase [Ensifer sp.]|jgi:nucleoside-diphosphate-sugar epimerase|uniref:NAD-dependent epimerase/dehydratase family protein n=1 Tax=Ensifer sp. TaxID=1872086 RepID=UPI002E15FA9B|nr:NAD(P)-dependent oxidoreductase [Ensifer sp.]